MFDPLLRWAVRILLSSLATGITLAGTFGTVVPIGGQAADITLDEGRGVVYVANYTANRIDVVSMATKKVVNSINVAPQPASLSLSPDGRYLVIAHLSNFATPAQKNGLTVIDLTTNQRQTFTYGKPTVGVMFAYGSQALVVTSNEFMLVDPATGYHRTLATIGGLITVADLPAPITPPSHPPDIIRASINVSADQTCIWGSAQLNDDNQSQLLFRYDAVSGGLSMAAWFSSPPPGPRVVSVNKDGSKVLAAWGLWHQRGFLLAQFPDSTGEYGFGSHVFDPYRGVVYAQVSNKQTGSGLATLLGSKLVVADDDNLTVRETLNLKENLSGKSILDAAGNVMYSVSESGLTILPVGTLGNYPRLATAQEDLVFRGGWCDRRVLAQTLDITDPGGGRTDFTLSSDTPGVMFSPASGTTPAHVQVSVDMNAFQGYKGTKSGLIQISSGAAVNVPPTVRVLINNHEPDQRGTFFNVPGTVVDVAADPKRNRFYVLRQDKNQVLVYDSTNYQQLATLRTGNTPWTMTTTRDGKYLIVGADNSQVAHVYNLDTLTFWEYIVYPFGHYPRYLATSGRAILTVSRNVGTGAPGVIDQVDVASGTASTLPSLGVWENKLTIDAAVAGAPSGSSIVLADTNGLIAVYDATADTFISARQDTDKLKGAIAALGEDTFVVDNLVLNSSLVPVLALDTAAGGSSGFAMADGLGLRTVAPDPAAPGVIERIDFDAQSVVRPTRMTEAPLLPQTVTVNVPSTCQEVQGVLICTKPTVATTFVSAAFTRGLVTLPQSHAIVSLSTSGFVVLPWEYDAAVADPQITAIMSAADQSANVAPGGLFTIAGTDLSPISAASTEVPLPTALAETCMTVNGTLVPMIFVSPTQINGQIPFGIAGAATMVLHTTAGISNNFKFNIADTAPAVFQVNIKDWNAQMATVVRSDNYEYVTPSNPIHPDDWISIFLTGMGATSPEIRSGYPGPSSPLANAVAQPTVTLGGVVMPMSYAGAAPGQVGVYQINIHVPFKGVPTGMSIPLTIVQGNTQTTVNVRVVH